jgi:hypothetical protein
LVSKNPNPGTTFDSEIEPISIVVEAIGLKPRDPER